MGLFDKVERGLERAVNSAFAKAFKSEVQPVELASAIRRAMDDRAAVHRPRPHDGPEPLHDRALRDRLRAPRRLRGGALRRARRRRAGACRLPALPARGPVQITFHRDEEPRDRRVPGPARDVAPLDRPEHRGAAPSRRSRPPRTPPWPPRPSGPPAAPSPGPWLVIDGERYPLIGAHTVIGRDELADVVLDDPGISRRHSEIRVTNDGPHLVTSIRDLGSTNGTFVNGERITSTRARRGGRDHHRAHPAVFRPGKR